MSTVAEFQSVGLSHILANYSSYNNSNNIIKFIIENIALFPDYAELIEQSESMQLELIDYIYDKKITMNGSIFKKINLDEIFSGFETNVRSFLTWNRGNYLSMLKACYIFGNFSWKKILDNTVHYVSNTRYYDSSSLFIVFAAAAKNNTKDFLELGEKSIFCSKNKMNHNIRRAYYHALISGGLLTEKSARLIRSDSSEYASEGAVETLLVNTHLYSNIDKLLLLFSDTRYIGVAKTLATGTPKHLLTSLLGTPYDSVKRIIENRMQSGDEVTE